MPTSPGFLVAAGGAVVLVLIVAALVLAPRLRGGPTGQVGSEARDHLLHHGLRAQATITSVRSAGGGRVFVTSASGVDPVSGRLKTYTQRGPRSIGRRGEPVTILVDAARPNDYLIVP